MVQKQSTVQRTGQSIDTDDAVVLETETPGDAIVSLNIEATAAASYAIDVSATGEDGDWFEDEVVYDQADVDDATDVRDSFVAGDAYLRVRVTDPAAGGETADVTVQQAH